MEAHTGEFRREDGRYQNFVAVPDMVNYYAWDRAQRKICPVEIAGQTLTGGTDIAIFDRCKVLNGGSVQSFWAKGCPACCVPTGARNTFNLVTDIVLWPREYTTKSLVIVRHPHPFTAYAPPPPNLMCAQTHTQTQTHATRSAELCLILIFGTLSIDVCNQSARGPACCGSS